MSENSEESQTGRRKRQRMSKVWDHFTLNINEKTVVCVHCKTELAYHSSTTSIGTDLIILFVFLYISGFVFKARMCETMHGLVPSFQAYVVPELQKVKTCSSESEVSAYLNP